MGKKKKISKAEQKKINKKRFQRLAEAITGKDKKSGKKVSELAELMETFPQVLYNVTIPAEKKGHWQEDADIAALIEKYTEELGDNGRILVRESGTEPLVRVMVEGKDARQIETAAQAITEQVKIFAGA